MPGLRCGQRLIDREAGDDILVEVVGDVDRTLPDELAALVLDALGAVAVELRQELRVGQQRRDAAIADPVELQIGRLVMLTETSGMPRRAVDGSTKLSPVKRTIWLRSLT